MNQVSHRAAKMSPFLFCCLAIFFSCNITQAQVNWKKVTENFGAIPAGMDVYTSTDSLDGKPFIAYYAIADLKNKQLQFTTDTTFKRRLTPAQFFEKNSQPLLVVNTSFFSFETNQNLNIVIKDGRLVSYNVHSLPGKGKDTFTYRHSFTGALGISKKRTADVAWTYTDSSDKSAYASQSAIASWRDSTMFQSNGKQVAGKIAQADSAKPVFKKWKMQTGVGGGPVLVQNGAVKISNNEEWKFAGKAINDQHPRTLMGYTADHKLIVMAIEGRNPQAAGATLEQAGRLMVALGCIEALNLDGGGSTCMLINGKETVHPSDKGVERPVPAVFIISGKSK